jgi:hypothetical protein
MAEGVGNAPTSAHADPVFETGAASLYLPAFLKMQIAECRLQNHRPIQCANQNLQYALKMVAGPGLAPGQSA